MYDIQFRDYIEKYKEVDNSDWITLYEKSKKIFSENDIFTFCALMDKNKISGKDYLNEPNWNFASDSFGKSTFGSSGYDDENILFFDGTQYNEFEYLIAVRCFEKYEPAIEINPKFIWYGNLVKQENGYVDSLTDKLIIKNSLNHIEVKREYLKDFLCAHDKVCIIVFEHHRSFTSKDKIEPQYERISGTGYCMSLSISSFSSTEPYNSRSILMGKSMVFPFRQPRHRDYKYYAEEKQYEEFIIAYNEDQDKKIEFTCNEAELENGFGANSSAPNCFTPVFFNINVLDKYKNDPRNYKIDDSDISYLNRWRIPFSINKERGVFVFLKDLSGIPYEEQKYWKPFNILPDGKMDPTFVDMQFHGVWNDSGRIESKLLLLLNRLNEIIKGKFNDIIFNELNNTDKQIYNAFIIPTNYSIPEYQSFLMQLSKITAESINVKLIKNALGDDYEKLTKNNGSIFQLGAFLKFIKIDEDMKISNAIKKAYNCRNKLAGHNASPKEYNKLWKRNENAAINTIDDAGSLIKEIVCALTDVLVNTETKKADG